MTGLPCNTVQEYNVPPGITQLQIQVESKAPGSQSNSTVAISVQPGGAVRVTLHCSATDSESPQGTEK